MKSFICLSLPLSSYCLSISTEVSLSFKWIVCLLNYDCKLSTHPSVYPYSSDLSFTLCNHMHVYMGRRHFFLFLFIQWHFNLFFSLIFFQPFMSTSSNAHIHYFRDICNLTWVMHDSYHVITTKTYHHHRCHHFFM